MGAKQCRIAIADGTLVSGVLAFTWKDPDTIDGTEITVQLEYAPKFYWVERTGANGSVTLGILTVTAITANGGTVTSLILGTPASTQTADVSTFRVFAVCRAEDFGGA